MKTLTQTELLTEIKNKCLAQKLTLAVAESVTAGLLQNYFSRTEKAMQFFQGGMTLYNLGQKTRHLDVNPILGENSNCVSKYVAEKMALEISGKFCSEIGIGITGYAAPMPELDIDSLYAYIAVSKNGKILLSKRMNGDDELSMAENQELYIRKTLEHLYQILDK